MSLQNTVSNQLRDAELVTQQQIHFQLLRLYIGTFPYFNGNNSTLEIFLKHCEHLINTYNNLRNRDDPINNFHRKAIINQLRRNTLTLVGVTPEISDWNDIKKLLRSAFGDQRNLDCLVQEVIQLWKLYKMNQLLLSDREYKNTQFL